MTTYWLLGEKCLDEFNDPEIQTKKLIGLRANLEQMSFPINFPLHVSDHDFDATQAAKM